ncbi:hypothetical protein C2E21_9164 [Chlorella sorokiniana]|uniref:HAUS augmin-like complex subunit 6 N-terminal domain-containing protein n=1 Tax=Chlorella sorokiniana TaxID=3076 RepID=A0A2P6TC36_CHLSO|nr:hypothetical protein C2E21_9164 [Chlorella sorokiniana]|eukprot:PRW20172.1 hypothetical protein C2E21_9164 [Chlorella sorokiniana]
MADRRRAQEAAAATALAAALACLRGPGTAKEPKEALTAAALARPTLKTMQTALHLLHLRIRGAARTKKELQHIYPVLEPGQAKEFKAAMQEWVRELGAAGQLQPDSVKYFVSAYQGSAAHRAVLLLLDLSTLALAKELGQGPHVELPSAELLRPCCAAGAGPPPQQAHRAAADAQRQLQARMDAVVAAMQRLKQLHTQATGQLAAGQGTSGTAAAALAPRAPLFAGSQAAIKRGELVSELLVHGPSLTAQPEAVGPESWADLLAAGKGSAAAAAAAGAATPPPATARRLSNPVQEASNFAAEGMAADADVLTVHGVLVQRLAAASAALQAASSQSGMAAGGADVRAALAEAAACRESLMLSVRQELAAARVRDEQQAAAAADGRGSLLQLLPLSQPPCNPVAEGMRISQQAAAAVAAEGDSSPCLTTRLAPQASARSTRSVRSTGGITAAGGSSGGGCDLAELQKRLLAIDKGKGRR